MPSLSAILDTVIRGQNNFCCLCFNTVLDVSMHDKINIQIVDTERNILVKDILQSLFGEKLQEYMSIFDNICEDCLKSIVNIYTFIKTCHYNALLLTKSLEKLYSSTEFTNNEIGEIKTLFVSLNLKNFATKHFYDIKKLDSTHSAMSRFKFLTRLRAKGVSLPKKSKSPNNSNIKTIDMLLDPNDQSRRKCKMCFQEFVAMNELRTHFMKLHAPKTHKCHIIQTQSKANCSECGKIFKSSVTLKKHKLMNHKKIICSDCGCSYRNKIAYKKHLELNTCKKESRASPANAQLTCDYCGKKYTQKMSLRVHIQYEHGNYKAHICEWCGKKFWAQSRLKAHIVKHTKEKNFTCSICQGKFVTRESLLYHTRLHTGEKPYKCSKCSCTFISSSRRAYHMKTYHFMAAEECDICHSKFTSRMYLEKHKKIHKQSQDSEVKENKTQKLDDVDGSKKSNNESILVPRNRPRDRYCVSKKIALVDAEIQSQLNDKQSMLKKHSSQNIYDTPNCETFYKTINENVQVP